ncbi:MAG TPA: hypothetical protein VMZ30_07485 [Pyrinomonadaceae bacterium]|nr:hypothetical protein [Pyrinomonadaceae bacterium]
MSKLQCPNQPHPTKESLASGYWTSLVFDLGLWTLDIGLVMILCAVTSFAQDDKCLLRLADLPEAPELFGFRMGMTTLQVKRRVPQITFGKVNEFGVSKTSISPDFNPQMDKTTLAGIRTLSFDFLDDRVSSLWFGYDNSFKWQTVPDFVTGISKSLRLTDAWQPWKTRGQQLKCADFQITVGIVAEGPSFHIIDESAEQITTARRQALQDENDAGEEMETVEIVANKKTRTYYVAGCAPAQAIEEGDRVMFKSKEDAEKAGYKLAKKCE